MIDKICNVGFLDSTLPNDVIILVKIWCGLVGFMGTREPGLAVSQRLSL